MKRIFWLAVLLGGLAACDPGKVFEENVPIEGKNWRIDEAVHFKVLVTDTVSTHNIYVNVRTFSDYPYSNLYLFIHVTSPAGDELTDTVDFRLADDRGRWLGRGIGDLYFLQLPYKKNIRFPVKGVYRFDIEQGMRTDLPGVRDVGLRVERVKEPADGKKE